ncbi:hypothetical protein BDR26DRAFT_703771 [Obelidium mucronatum]|nr:hypothetical protein BDR26DRAFT_703771 [Obelidium mucronatum]
MFRSASRLSTASVRLFSASAPSNGLFQAHIGKLRGSIKEVSVQDLSAALADGPKSTFHLFDVRETNEWNQGRIPHAFYTGRGNLERDIVSVLIKVLHLLLFRCNHLACLFCFFLPLCPFLLPLPVLLCRSFSVRSRLLSKMKQEFLICTQIIMKRI